MYVTRLEIARPHVYWLVSNFSWTGGEPPSCIRGASVEGGVPALGAGQGARMSEGVIALIVVSGTVISWSVIYVVAHRSTYGGHSD